MNATRAGREAPALRSYHHSAFPAERIAAEREQTVSVCLPARNEVDTIGPILRCLMPLLERGAIDEVVVLDDSIDGTGDVARSLGARVYRQSDLRPQLGPVDGKGDALWRGLWVLTGEVVCFLDADSERFGEHFACGLVGAVTCEPGVVFAKGHYRRPFRAGGLVLPEGGGRVTEVMARPLLNIFYPELAAFHQPLAGELAARRELLEAQPFVTGYGVDIALLIDVWREAGIGRLAQVDLEVRQNRHKQLRELVPMAEEVLAAVLSRVVRERGQALVTEPGIATSSLAADGLVSVRVDERPPLAPAPATGR